MSATPARILLVEDNPGDARLIQEMLREAVGATVYALEIKERMEQAQEYLWSNDPVLILLDLSLPDSQGLETFTTIQILAAHIPVIVLTGNTDSDLALAAVQAGAQDFLVKGEINPDMFLRAIKYSIGRKKSERLLRQAEDRFTKIFHANPHPIIITNVNRGCILECNSAWIDEFNYARGELLIGTSLEPGIWLNSSECERFMEAVMRATALRGYETQWRKKSGAIADVLLSVEIVNLEYQPHFIIAVSDVTGRKRADERIQYLATRDPLTGLPNRLLLTDRLKLSLSNAQRTESKLGLLFIDLDRFKNINDSLGHLVGDAFLTEVAARLGDDLRQGDTLARIGGDQFVVLMEGAASIDQVVRVALKLLPGLSAPFQVHGNTINSGASVGISIYPDDGNDTESLLSNAELAMQHAKLKGGGVYEFFSGEMNTRMRARLQLEAALRDALALKQFQVVYQPKVDVTNGRIGGVEALLRWTHPELGSVPPDRFIPVAEDTGMIADIGMWVLREACTQARLWHDSGHAGLRVAVNLSVRQFSPNLAVQIAAVLRETGVAPALLELEITESVFVRQQDENEKIFQDIADLGVHMSLDDFGTGYASMNYIKRFRFSVLKIDRSFVRDLDFNAKDLAIVKATLAMAHSMGISVIAEGVETKNQLNVLRSLGCDQYQGYLCSKPLSAAALTQQFLNTQALWPIFEVD